MLSLKQLAWTMMIQRRRRVVADDQKMLGASVLASLAPEKVRIVRALSPEYEFRHDQMRAFLCGAMAGDERSPNPFGFAEARLIGRCVRA